MWQQTPYARLTRHCQLNSRYPDFLKFPLTPLYEKSGVAHVNSQVFSQFIGGFIIKLTMPPLPLRHGTSTAHAFLSPGHRGASDRLQRQGTTRTCGGVL